MEVKSFFLFSKMKDTAHSLENFSGHGVGKGDSEPSKCQDKHPQPGLVPAASSRQAAPRQGGGEEDMEM